MMARISSSEPGDYVYFKSQVPLHKISIGTIQWRYYDFGPKDVPPLICIPGVSETADVFYKQIMFLTVRGHRVVSIDIPQTSNENEWVQGFQKFLDVIGVYHVHLYGTGLGGFLAQCFAQNRPRQVKSLVLSNTFLKPPLYSTATPLSFSWSPLFLLKRYILSAMPKGAHEPFIADSIDFVVGQIETLSKDDLASRLTLCAYATPIGRILLPDYHITFLDTIDQSKSDSELYQRYPNSTLATLKSGGDFPFLSRPDEVNLHLQLHLRRVGVVTKMIEPEVPVEPKLKQGERYSDPQIDENNNDDDNDITAAT
ncbi:putative Maspardin [Zostera marina]|uniref:Maspardin n=1 Tax=Zostera marina TaxID=29655 RepID=A0A0K9P6S3_ZOSMR|nr:putative Maspardin [Zostera marina]